MSLLEALFCDAVHCGRAQGLSAGDAESLVRSLAPREVALSLVKMQGESTITSPLELGARYAALDDARARKRRGSFFTPAPLAALLTERSVRGRRNVRSVLDPAMGAGALLAQALTAVPVTALWGIDRDPIAVWIARVTLALLSRTTELSALITQLRVGDALAKGALDAMPHFDAIVGNPPWIAHAGRQTVKLSDAAREDYRKRFRSFSGFPTTHALFVELCARALAVGGRMALLVPTQVADLQGYGAMREALTSLAEVDAPLDELGFSQFEGVTEPTLVLCATRVQERAGSPASLPLKERANALSLPPSLRATLDALPRFAPSLFGEAGFQSAGALSKTHLCKAPTTERRFSVPLREGKDVTPYLCRAPSKLLDPDPKALSAAKTRLRDDSFYRTISVVIRQTARFPIAAVHEPPCGFRNSLIAAYSDDPHVLAGLLNSTLLRLVHLASQRDGRQAVFPQLKVAHLRALPAPPSVADVAPLRALSMRAHEAAKKGESLAVLQAAIDVAVNALYGLDEAASRFVSDHAESAAY